MAQAAAARGWHTHIQIDRSRGRVLDVFNGGETLFALTDRGGLHAIDAETGRTHWTTQAGRPEHPSLAPAANDKYVAVVNGSRIYIIDRVTGRAVWDRPLGDAPGAGPVLTDTLIAPSSTVAPAPATTEP